MSKRTNKIRLFTCKHLVIILLFIASLFQNQVFAQQIVPKTKNFDTTREIAPSTIKLDSTLTFKNDSLSLFKKIIQPIKFRENRNNRMKDSMYHFMMNLIREGELKIDSVTVNEIMIQIEKMDSRSNVNNKRFEDAISGNDSASKSNEKRIDDFIQTYDLDNKTSEAVTDSLKILMSAVIQENAINNSRDMEEISSGIDAALKEIRKVQYSTSSDLAKVESAKIQDTLFYFKRSLNPRIKVIGWHSSKLGDKFKHYNYNYLSAINLDSYQLAETGKSKNQAEIQKFQKSGDVIAFAQGKGCDVHLTVSNNNAGEINSFLRNSNAQETLMFELNKLIRDNKLKGININFSEIYNSKTFVRFINKLYKNLKTQDPSIQLTISLPAVKNNEVKKKIGFYDFSALNSIVDYYYVLTDDIIPTNVKVAQSASPLYTADKFREWSIESTMEYYNYVKIPISKLIMMVSYTGIIWQVSDFSGNLVTPHQKEILSYADILENFTTQQNNGQTIIEGYDSEQVANFLNVFGPDSDKMEQVWFEDERSLFKKYEWALENELGGVAIRRLGNDDGYPELWKALGASLIKIDTVFVKYTSEDQIRGVKKFWKIFINASKGFKLKTFKRDVKWARVVRLKYNYDGYDDGVKVNFRRFDSKLNETVGSVKDTIAEYIVNRKIWEETMPYKTDSSRNDEAYMENKSYCYSLYTRWTIYAKFFKWCWILFFVFAAVLFSVSRNSERYLLGSKKVRKIIRHVPSALILFTLLFASFWLYFDPSIEAFGAGSEEGTESLLMFYVLLIGIAFGGFVTYRFVKYKGS